MRAAEYQKEARRDKGCLDRQQGQAKPKSQSQDRRSNGGNEPTERDQRGKRTQEKRPKAQSVRRHAERRR